MGGYKIKVKVEVVECSGAQETGTLQLEDGNHSLIISESDAMSIDKCENALLRTAHPAIREAISSHLSSISKKKRQSRPNDMKLHK